MTLPPPGFAVDPPNDLARMRVEYAGEALTQASAPADPYDLFATWMAAAITAGISEPNAMGLATIAADGSPALRMVLLKGASAAGFVFFTNYRSAKGQALTRDPRCALLFDWLEQRRQVRIRGQAHPISREETTTYFATRPRAAQLGAWASPQSEVVASRQQLIDRYAAMEAKFGDAPIPAPPHWGGFLVVPHEYEFWQGQAGRMHDRLRYQRRGSRWHRERLAP